MIRRVAQRLPPQVFVRLVDAQYRVFEPELRTIGLFVARDRLAVDVGAWWGPWTRCLARYASVVHAFEPHPDIAAHLSRVTPDNVVVHPYALSNASGAATLHVPSTARGGEGVGSLAVPSRETELSAVAFPVRASRLDDFALEPVGFVKIDVEGHELAVLHGSRETIGRDRPVVVVEIEERFHPDGGWRDVFDWFAELGYRGSVFASGEWRPEGDVDWLRAQRRQTPDGSLLALTFAARRYLRNFVFVPEEQASYRASGE